MLRGGCAGERQKLRSCQLTRPNAEGVFCGKDLLNEFYTPTAPCTPLPGISLYRAEVWKLLHYPEGRLHEDDFVAHRLFWRCDKVVCVDKVLYHYRLRGGSICRTNTARRPLMPWTAWLTATASMSRTVLTEPLIDAAYAACWRRYLFLCAKVRQNPTPELVKAISKEQFLMQGLISYLPNCRQMKMTEKLPLPAGP